MNSNKVRKTQNLTSEQVKEFRKGSKDETIKIIYAAIEHARNGIIITDHLDPQEPIIYCNNAFLKLTGYTKKEILGKNCRFLQGKDRNQPERLKLKQAIEQEKPVHVQIKNYKKNGKMFWNDLLMSPIKDKNGNVTHFSGNQLDVTKRKEAEEAIFQEKALLEQRVKERTLQLNETKEYLESIVETVRQPLLVLDGNMHVISANRFFYKTFKVKPKATEGKLLYNLGNGQWNIPKLRMLLEKVLPEQNPFVAFEVQHEFPSIGTRIMVLNARQVELRGSKQERILLAIEDLTDVRFAENSSRRSQALTQSIINSLNAHIAVLDRHGVIIEVNNAWAAFALQNSSSSQRDTYIGQNYLEVLKNSKGDKSDEAPLAYEGIRKVMAGKIPSFSLEYPCFTKDKQLWFLLQVTPLQSKNDGAVVAHIDITERKHAEIRKDDFISMASHELKTPITSMKIYIQSLQKKFEKQHEQTAYESMTKVDTQIEKLTRLVNELLDVSRMYAGKLEISAKQFDLYTLVKGVVDDLKATLAAHKIKLKKSPNIDLVGDADRIEQVVINLITNAMKYSPKGSDIEVSVKTDKTNAIVSVKDQGIGIPKSHHLYVFDRFYQVASNSKKTYPGLGMGLYISKQIVTRHNGKIWIESEPGKGSTFYFSLPLQKS